jgi:hypothetical protein
MPAMAIHVTPMWNPGQEMDFNSSERILKILQDGSTAPFSTKFSTPILILFDILSFVA